MLLIKYEREREKEKYIKRKRQRENRRTFSGLWWLLWLFFGGDVFGAVGAVGAVVVVGVRVFRQTLRRVARCRCSWQAFPFWRSFGRRLLSLAVMVFFIRQEIKKPLQSVNG